mgnify:CR=1 FL=1
MITQLISHKYYSIFFYERLTIVASICALFYQQEFEADIYMRQFWKDPRLSYGDRNLTLTFQGDTLKKLWFPDTYFENSKKTFVHEDTRTVILFGDGNLLYSARSNW